MLYGMLSEGGGWGGVVEGWFEAIIARDKDCLDDATELAMNRIEERKIRRKM